MDIKDLGEKAFLSGLLPLLERNKNFTNGFGHDASIIDLNFADYTIAMKIDRAGKPIAAINDWTNYHLWGRLAVTANCSDILAVGGYPKGFMIAISVPGNWEVKQIEDIILGAQEECENNGITFLGGDTKESNEPHVVGSAIGLVSKKYNTGRKNAKAGDYLVLAGKLGGFVSAYLKLKDSDITQPEVNPFLEYISYPKARWSEALLINEKCLACASMDLSDGLYDALQNISTSDCGVLIDLNALPYHRFAKQIAHDLSISLFNLAFSVGDWGILYAVKEENINELKKLSDNRSIDLHILGKTISKKGVFGVDKSKNEYYEVEGIVNENFKSRMEDEGSYFSKFKENNLLQKIKYNDKFKNFEF